jgi:hypothetical protein
VNAIWWVGILVGFMALLLIPAAIAESRWSRAWIARLNAIQEGRQRMERERDRELEERRAREIHNAALWIKTHTWRGY